MKITVETIIKASLNQVWSAWTTAEDVVQWNFASEDWCCPRAQISLKVGDVFQYRMEAVDGSMGFDLKGTFTKIEKYKQLKYFLEDKREVCITFIEKDTGVCLIETFDAEQENPVELQEQGWQSILNNFKKYVEKNISIGDKE